MVVTVYGVRWGVAGVEVEDVGSVLFGYVLVRSVSTGVRNRVFASGGFRRAVRTLISCAVC